MRNKFLVISAKEIFKYGVLAFILVVAVGYGIRNTYDVIETSSNSRLLPIYSVERKDNKVALTFDCAWGADDIQSIVDMLEDNDIKATFFVVGTWVDKYPEAVRLLADNGHDIGNHSNSHSHVNKLSYDANIDDMKKANDKIKSITDVEVNLYRGPYGEYNNTVISAAKELKMEVIQWDVDTLDYLGKSVNEMCARIKDKIRNGSIILMHNDTENTANGLQKIIDTIENMGYEIVPVSELIYYENYTIDNTGRQIKTK